MTMKIRVENTYSDGHESVELHDIPDYTGDPDDTELFEEHLRPYTGDGHGIGRKVYALYTVTVLEASNPALVGRTEEYGG
ncbi:MAG: hypothetical protein PHQ28_00520 [Mycobacterium sp.]|nr:hypothetical protein [Mycobacterium sp.]